MRISDWSSDVCSSDLEEYEKFGKTYNRSILTDINRMINRVAALTDRRQDLIFDLLRERIDGRIEKAIADGTFNAGPETMKATSLQIISEKIIDQDVVHGASSEEHTTELQSLMRISYAVFCVKKKNKPRTHTETARIRRRHNN